MFPSAVHEKHRERKEKKTTGYHIPVLTKHRKVGRVMRYIQNKRSRHGNVKNVKLSSFQNLMGNIKTHRIILVDVLYTSDCQQ